MSDYDISKGAAATRDAVPTAEATRIARETYAADRAARAAELVGREDFTRTQLMKDVVLNRTVSPAYAIAESPVVQAMRAIEDSPTLRMLREIENSPALRLLRDIESSPTMRMMRELERSPSFELSRSIAESMKSLDLLTRPSISTTVVTSATLVDGRVMSHLSGIAALQAWAIGLRARNSTVAASLMSPALDAFSALTDASRHLLEQQQFVQSFAAVPEYLRAAPTIESYASASTLFLFAPPSVDDIHIIDALAEEMLDGVSEEFEARLASLDQGLLKPIRGAWQTAVSDTEDRVRQSATSIRFVVETMIKQLAPRNDAEAWARAVGCSKKPPHGARDARSAGKWTVQLRFIMRHVDAVAAGDDSESVFGYLAEKDLVDMLLLLERLNQAVHERDAEIADRDLTRVLRRVMAFMTLLLDAYEFEESE